MDVLENIASRAFVLLADRSSGRLRLVARGILLATAAVLCTSGLFAQAGFQSNASGNWNSAATWTLVSGTDADGIPDADDSIDVVNGHTVIVNAASTITKVTVTSGTLDIRGVNFTVNGTTSVSGSVTFTTSTLGTKTFIGTITVNNGGSWSHAVNEAVVLRGGVVNNGSFSTGTGAYTLNTNSQAFSGSNPITFGGNLAITGAITITNNTTVNVVGSLTGSVAGSTWLNAAGSTLNAGAAVLATGTLTATANPNTVNYNGGGAQTMKATTYHDLSVTKSANTATFGGTTTVNNVFRVVSGTAATGANSITISDTTEITGTFTISSATGTKTFVGPVIVNSGGVWNNSSNEAITLQGGLTHNGTTFTAGTGVYTFDTNTQVIGGSSAIAIPSITVTGITLSNTGTLTVSTALAGTGGLTNAAAGTLNINFTGTPSITTLTASAVGNTVQYGAAGAQTIKVPTSSVYHHLNLATSGAKTAGGGLTVNGDLTLSGTATFNAGTSLTHSFAGSWILNTTAATPFAFTTASTINFDTPSPAASTTIGGTTIATLAFHNVSINNTSGVILNENISFQTGTTPTLTIGAGATLTPGAANVISGTTGTLTGSGMVKVTRTAATADFNTQYSINTRTLTNLTVDYDATGAQTVNALNYYGLIIQGSRGANSVTLETGTVGVSGTFSPIASFGGGGYVVTGNTVDFNGVGAQSVPALGYNNLTLSNAGTKTFTAGTSGIFATFIISGTATANATSNNATIDYNGSGAQTIQPINYNHLVLSNSGAKSFSLGTTGITGDFSITGSATADATTNTATIDFNGTGSQNVAVVEYYNLAFSNAGTKTFGTGTTQIAGTFTVSGAATPDAVTNSTTIEYTGTVNQNSPVMTYYNLVVNRVSLAGRLLVNDVTVNNDFTIAVGEARMTNAYFTVLGQTSISGLFRVSNAAATPSFGNVVVNTAGEIRFVVDAVMALNGNLQADGSALITSGANTWTFQKSGGGGTIGGTAAGITVAKASFTTDYSHTGTFTFDTLEVSGTTLTNNGSLTVSSALLGSGTLTQGSGANLTLSFPGTVGISTLNASASGNTVSYSALGAQSILAIDYANLALSGSGVKTFASGVTAASEALTVGGTAGADATTNSSEIEYNGGAGQAIAIMDYYDLTLSNAGTKSFGADTTRIAGSFSITGSASADATTNNPAVEYNGSASQAVQGLTYYDVIINNPAGVSLGSSTTVNNTLTLQAGTITTAANVVSIGTAGSVSRTSGHVVGNLAKDVPVGSPIRTFEIGDATRYTPTTMTFNSVSTAGTFTASTSSGDHPEILSSSVDAAKSVNRYWTLTNSGVVFSSYDVVFTFDAADVDGSANPASFILDRYKGGSWTPPTVGTLTATTSEAKGVTNDGDFQIGELTLAVLKTWDGGAGTNNWGDGNNWNPDGVPSSLNNVNLTGASTIDVNTAAFANSITLNNSSLLVTILSGNSLTVSGDLSLASGTLNTEASFPAVTGTVNITGGTVGYTGSGSQSVAVYAYYHVNLAGSGTKTFGSGTASLGGNLTLGGSAAADATTNSTTVDYNGSGAQSVGAINYHHLTLSNAGTKTFASGTVGIAGNLSMTGSASADATTNSTTVDYNGGGAQSVGTINYHHLTLSNAGTKMFAAGTTGVAGSLTVSGLATADATSNTTTIDYNGSGAQSIVQFDYTHLSLSNAGAKQFAAGTTSIAGNITVGGSASLDASTNATTINLNGSGSQTLPAANYANLTFANAGTKTLGAGTTRVSGTFSIAGSAVADLTSNLTTFEYTGTLSQDSPEITYYNLVSSNTGVRLLVNNVTVNNDFTVQLGQARVTNQNFTVTGLTTLNAELRITATGGAKTLGSVVVNTSGSLNFTAGEDLTINGDFTVNGSGAVTSNVGLWTFQKSGGGTLGGSSPSVTITNAAFTTAYSNSGSYSFDDLTITSVTLTNDGTVTVTDVLTGTGTFAQGSAGVLNYNSVSSMTIAGFTASASGNTVNYGASAAQGIGIADYYNLTLSGTGGKSFGSGTTRIAGAFTVGGSASADATTSNPTLEFNGTSVQAVEGLSYYRVVVNNTAGISLNGTLTVTNLLTLTNGTITTGVDSVIIGSGASVSRTSGHIVGGLGKTIAAGSPTVTFEVGDAAGNYTPVTTAFISVSVSDVLLVSTTNGDHPEILTSGLEPSKTVNRYWTLGSVALAYASYDITMNFVSGDVDGSANTANFIIGRYESATWSLPTVGTLTSTSSQATGVVGFGDFQIGEQSTFVLKTWDGGASTTNWGDGNNWNPNGIPGATNNVSLTGAVSIDIDVDATVNSITLNNATLLVTLVSGNTLTVSGDFLLADGTFNTEQDFPAVTGTVTISGGTFGYSAAGPQSVAVQSYHHLSFSGSGTKTLGAGTTVVSGDMTVGGTATVDGITNSSTVDYDGSAQSVAAIDYYNLTLSNSGTKTFAPGTTRIANAFSTTGSAGVDATTNATTIEYNGGGAQAVRAVNYHHLSLSNSGTKAFAAGTTGIAGNLTLSGSAAADATTNSTTLDYNGSAGQVVGTIDYGNLTLSNAGSKVFAAGTTRIAGNLVVSGSATADGAANATTIEFNGSSSQSVSAAAFHHVILSNGTSKILGAGTTSIAGDLTLTGGATIDAVGNATTIDFNGVNQTIPAIDYYAVTFSNSGTKTLSAGATGVAGTLTISGSASVDALTNTTTVEFNGTAIQASSAVTLYDLVIFKASGRLTLNDLTVAHDFTIQAGEGRLTGGSFAVSGTTSVSEILRISSTAGTLTLGDIVVSSSGQVIFAVNEDVTVNGSLQVDGSATFTAGTGLWTFQQPGGGTISGTAASLTIANAEFTTGYALNRNINFTGLTVTGATVTNNQTVVVAGSLAGTGAITQGSTATLSLAFAGATTLSALNASASGNVVEYTAAAGQDVMTASYYHLTLGNSGTKTLLTGTTGVAGVLTISGTAVVDATTNPSTVDFNGGSQSVSALAYHHLTLSGSGTKTLLGATSVAGNLTIGGSASVDALTNFTGVSFVGVSAQSVPSMIYYDLSLSGAGDKTASGDIDVNNDFSNASVFDIQSFYLTISGTGTNTGTIRFSGADNGVAFSGGTVAYEGSGAQTVTAGTYGNLVFSNGGTKTFAGSSTVLNTMTVSSGASVVVDPAVTVQIDGDLDLSGSLTNNGIVNVGN